jgi:hypothetical protein
MHNRLVSIIALCAFGAAAAGQVAPASPNEPADFASKLTIGRYWLRGGRNAVDVNLRHQTGDFTNWVGVYFSGARHAEGRIGTQYNFQRERVLIQPSLQTGTTRFVQGSVYSEVGGDNHFGIAGWSHTNLRDQNDLTFDPNNSAQIGFGAVRARERVAVFAIRDIRLHTGQQNTHAVWKHKLGAPRSAITFDLIYKSGHTGSGRMIHAVAGGIYVDYGWFAKLYYDPYASYGDRTQVRLSFGRKF